MPEAEKLDTACDDGGPRYVPVLGFLGGSLGGHHRAWERESIPALVSFVIIRIGGLDGSLVDVHQYPVVGLGGVPGFEFLASRCAQAGQQGVLSPGHSYLPQQVFLVTRLEQGCSGRPAPGRAWYRASKRPPAPPW